MLSQETSTQTGTYSFTIRVTDYDNKFFDKTFSITVIVVYPFTGSSEWNTAAHRSNNLIPPNTITINMKVIINHVAGGHLQETWWYNPEVNYL